MAKAASRLVPIIGFVRVRAWSYKVLYLFLKNKTSYKVLYFIEGLTFFDKSYFYVLFWLCLISLPKLYLKTRTCNTKRDLFMMTHFHCET